MKNLRGSEYFPVYIYIYIYIYIFFFYIYILSFSVIVMYRALIVVIGILGTDFG